MCWKLSSVLKELGGGVGLYQKVLYSVLQHLQMYQEVKFIVMQHQTIYEMRGEQGAYFKYLEILLFNGCTFLNARIKI